MVDLFLSLPRMRFPHWLLQPRGGGGHQQQGPTLPAEAIVEAELLEEDPREENAAADHANRNNTDKGKRRSVEV